MASWLPAASLLLVTLCTKAFPEQNFQTKASGAQRPAVAQRIEELHRAAHPDCADARATAAHPSGEEPSTGAVIETWTLEACDKVIDYEVRLVPKAGGGWTVDSIRLWKERKAWY